MSDIRIVREGERGKYEVKLGRLIRTPLHILVEYMRSIADDGIHMRLLPHSTRIEVNTLHSATRLLELLNGYLYRYAHNILLCDTCQSIHDIELHMNGHKVHKRCRVCHSEVTTISLGSTTESSGRSKMGEFIANNLSGRISVEKIAKKLRIPASYLESLIQKYANRIDVRGYLTLYIRTYHLCEKCQGFNSLEYTIKDNKVHKRCRRGRCRNFSTLDPQDPMAIAMIDHKKAGRKYIPPTLRKNV